MSDALTKYIRNFEEAEEASQPSRNEAERGRDYFDGKQLSESEITALKRRRQPIVIENLIRPKVDYLCGLERQTRTDPKVYPRTAAHEDDANAATDALRYVADDQRLDIKRSAVFQNMLVEGYGGVEVIAARVRDGIDPKIVPIAWDRLFYDPHSTQPDFSDAQYLGFVTWMDTREAKANPAWAERAAVIDATMSKPTSSHYDTYDDKPRWTYWADSSRGRIRIVTIYAQRDYGWSRCVFTLAGELEPDGPSPWLDEDGKPACGLVMQSAYVDRDNDRYGIVRDYITLQDEVNKRRSKFLHLSNSRQIRVSRSVGIDADAVRKEMSRPDGVIVAENGDVEIIGTGDMAAGHFNLLAEAKQAIQITGPNATLQGKSGQDQSGRAILALQQGGMTEMAPLLDSLRDFNIRVYRAIWQRIRQFWTGERWVRVTDDEKNARFTGLNVTQAHTALMKLGEAVKSGEVDEQTARQYEAQIMMDPQMRQPVNVLAEMDVDIQIDEVADTPTLQIEQFEQLAKLAPMAPQEYVPTMFELLVEASNLRNKDKLREIMEKAKQSQSQPDPLQELQMRGAIAQVDKVEAEAQLTQAKAATEQTKPMIEGMKMGASLG